MEDFPVIQFESLVPVSDEGLVRHVQHALSLDLPELRDFEYEWRETINIVANGPSARWAPLAGKTVAINGALKLFTEKGLAPTYWAGCDPQAHLADFLKDAPESTVYLVASKCHPDVFDALKDRNVILWHVNDEATRPLIGDFRPVGRASSITTCMFEVLARLGWRDFHTWGWDGCLMDGKDHAVAQAHVHAELNIQVGDLTFPTTPTWGMEAQDAVHVLQFYPFPIHVHGGGMIGEVLKAYHPHRITTDRP